MASDDDERQDQEQPDDEQSGGQATKSEKGEREGTEEIRKLEEADEVPSDPRDWPDGKAKFLTFGGGDDKSDEPFGEGITGKLGPSDVHHQPDGSVIVQGEKADNPDDYKGEPIPGGPTDPDSPKLAGEPDLSDRGGGKSGEDAKGSGEDGEEPAESERRGDADADSERGDER